VARRLGAQGGARPDTHAIAAPASDLRRRRAALSPVADPCARARRRGRDPRARVAPCARRRRRRLVSGSTGKARPAKRVTAYTDGSCDTASGRGGWAYLLTYNGQRKVDSGFESGTTNNRME